MSMALNKGLELGLVFSGEVAQPLDMFLLAITFVTAIPLAGDEHHTEPS